LATTNNDLGGAGPRPSTAVWAPIRTAFDAWLHTYNHHRGHAALKGLPPAARVTSLSGQYTYAAAALTTLKIPSTAIAAAASLAMSIRGRTFKIPRPPRIAKAATAHSASTEPTTTAIGL
jgi:hypothetical protein